MPWRNSTTCGDLARNGEWLARARACPNRSVVRPSGESKGVGPSADPGEEMALPVSGEVVGLHVNDASLVNVAWCDVSGGNEVAEPLGGIGVDFIVICGSWLAHVIYERQ
jgi:hypothetical protein